MASREEASSVVSFEVKCYHGAPDAFSEASSGGVELPRLSSPPPKAYARELEHDIRSRVLACDPAAIQAAWNGKLPATLYKNKPVASSR